MQLGCTVVGQYLLLVGNCCTVHDLSSSLGCAVVALLQPCLTSQLSQVDPRTALRDREYRISYDLFTHNRTAVVN